MKGRKRAARPVDVMWVDFEATCARQKKQQRTDSLSNTSHARLRRAFSGGPGGHPDVVLNREQILEEHAHGFVSGMIRHFARTARPCRR